MDMHLEPIMTRPFLPHDLIYIPTETGLAFQRSQRVMSVHGRNAYDRFSRLASRLDGSLSIAQLDSLLSPNEIPAMERLLFVLMEKQFLLPYDERLDDLPLELRSVFDQQIRFLHHLSASPSAAFLNFREADIRISGSGDAMQATITALSRNGSACVSELGSAVRSIEAELVLYVSDTPNLRSVLELSTLCRSADVPFLAAVVIAGNAVIGPFVEPGSATCWEDALLRVLEHQPAALRAQMWRHIAMRERSRHESLPAGAPQLQILGNHVAFAAFMALSGVRRNTDLLETIDLETLNTQTAALLPHPVRSPDPTGTVVLKSRRGPTGGEAESGFEGLGLVGTVCGVFHAFEDDNLLQVPVFRTSLRAHLDGYVGGDAVFVANSFQSNAEARALALADACCQHAVSVGADRAPEAASPETATAEAATAGGTVSPAIRIAVRDIAGMVVRSGGRGLEALETDVRPAMIGDGPVVAAVPAATLFRPTGASAIEPENALAGVGCGTSIAQARQRAVLSLLRFETLKALALGFATLTRIPLAANASGLMGLTGIAALAGRTLQCAGIGIHEHFVAIVAPAGDLADPTQMAVGCGSTQLEATREALVEAAALATGGESARTVARLLPPRLGYQRQGWIVRDDPQPVDRLPLDLLCPGRGRGAAELLHLDITPIDLRHVGLHVARTLLARVDTGSSSRLSASSTIATTEH